MNTLKKMIGFIFCVFILFFVEHSLAQSTQAAPDEKGEVTIPPKDNFNRINELKSAERIAVKNAMDKQFKVISGSPHLNPPVGFNIKAASGITPVSNFGNKGRITYYATFALHPLQKDKNSGTIKPSYEYTSAIKINANNIEGMCLRTGYFYEICQKLKIPLFFQQFPVVKSTEDYEEINFGQYGFNHFYQDFPVRILKRNNRPVFIPYTRKEFFGFLKKYYQAGLEDNEGTRNETEKTFKEIKAYIADNKNPQSQRDAYQKSLKSYENSLAQWQKNLDENRALLKRSNEAINTMPPDEGKQTTYIDMDKKGSFLDKLSQPGRQDGKPIYQINPDYFDRKSPISDIQFLVVTYEFHKSISNDFIKKKVKDVFNSIDFHELKLSMK